MAGPYNGTAINSPSYVASPSAAGQQAISLDGTTQYVQVPDTGTDGPFAFSTTGSYTIEVEFKATAALIASPSAQLMGRFLGGSADLQMMVQSGKPTVVANGLTFMRASSALTADNAVHSVVMEITTGTALTLFVDGVNLGYVTGTFAHPVGTALSAIGAAATSSSVIQYFPGVIEALRVSAIQRYDPTYPFTPGKLVDDANTTALYNFNGNVLDTHIKPPLAVALTQVGAPTAIALTATATSGSAPYTYQFQKYVSGAWSNLGVAQSSTSSTTYTDSGLPNDTSGQYRVSVTDSEGTPVTATSPTIIGRATHAPTSYFVDGAAGNDSNTGLIGAAWATMAQVNRWAFVPSDIISFRAGQTFAGTLTPQQSGTYNRPIVYTSYGTGQAIISNGTSDVQGALLLNAGGVTFRNLAFVGPGVTYTPATPTATSVGTKIGVEVYSTATSGPAWSSVYIDNCTISGYHDGLWFHTPVANGSPVVGYTDIRVTSTTIHDCFVYGLYMQGSATKSGAPWFFPTGTRTFVGVRVQDCHIYNIYGDPNGNPVIGSPFWALNCTRLVTDNCVFHDSGQVAGLVSGAPGGGVGAIVYMECTQSAIQWCEAYNIHTTVAYDGCAFDLDGATTNCLMHRNYTHDNDGPGFLTGLYPTSGPTTGNIIRYNVSIGDGKKNSSPAIYAPSSTGPLIHNNTVIVRAVPGVSAPPALGVTNGTGAQAYNNVLIAQNGCPLVRVPADTTLAGNLYWSMAGTTFAVTVGGVTYGSLAALQAAGYEVVNGAAVGLSADPRLPAEMLTPPYAVLLPAARVSTLAVVDPPAGSPAVAAGIDLLTVLSIDPGVTDLHGFPTRAAAQPTVGAVEYGAGALVAIVAPPDPIVMLLTAIQTRINLALPAAAPATVGGLPVAQNTANTLQLDPTQTTAGAAKGTVLGGIRAAESGVIGRKAEAPATPGATAGPGTLTTYDVAGQVEVVDVVNDIAAPTTITPTS